MVFETRLAPKRKPPGQRWLSLLCFDSWRGFAKTNQERGAAPERGGFASATRTDHPVAGVSLSLKGLEMVACCRLLNSGRPTAVKVGESARAISAPYKRYPAGGV